MARALCPHHVSHYLGMDVHDIGTVKKNIKTEPSFIFTVEPGWLLIIIIFNIYILFECIIYFINILGVYISKNNLQVHEEFLGLGIRIEDDVLVTENSIEVLSKDCPKEIADIEKIMSSQLNN